MRLALAGLACALLVAGAAATLGDNGMTTYDGRTRANNTLVFGNQLVIDNAVRAGLEFTQAVLTGTYKPERNDPPTEKKKVELECLNSIAPPPLNWPMWCPGKDAVVEGWTDKSGAAHRSIKLRPQKNMTSTMATWFITTHVLGLMPPVVEFEGNKYYYYHLWHPLDHVEAAWAVGPAVPILQRGPPLYTLIHERYRNTKSDTSGRFYETDGWFYVSDALNNLPKNRYVITMPVMGLTTWTMMIEFQDTPEGMVVDIEVIAGVPQKGYDEHNPTDGFLFANGMNELVTAPLLAKQKDSPDWENSINAITRHAIEEFSNLQFFVPVLYERCTLLGKAGVNWVPSLGTWLQYNNRTPVNAETISFYNALSALASKQINMANTTWGSAVNSTTAAASQLFEHVTDVASQVVVGKSQATYVPVSNAVTKYAYETNKANGAQPGSSLSLQGLAKAFTGMWSGSRSDSAAAAAPAPTPVVSVSPAASGDKDDSRITIRFGG